MTKKKKLVMEVWSNEPLKLQTKDLFGPGVLNSTNSREVNYVMTRLCASRRRQHCARLRRGGWRPGGRVNGICSACIPHCHRAKEDLIKQLSKKSWGKLLEGERYRTESIALGQYLHQMFEKCRKLKLIVEEE